MKKDNWEYRSEMMLCKTCMYFVGKVLRDTEEVDPEIGRCRRSAPTMKGWPVMFVTDWCGEHKLDENKI